MVRRVCRELGTQEATSSSSTTRPTTATAASPDGRGREAHRRRARGSRSSATRRPASGSPASKRSSAKIGVKADLRPVGHAVLPARLGLPRGHAVPLGRLRLLADRRHRSRHRQDSARAGRRQRDDRRAADLPRPVAAHPRRPAEEGPQDRRRRPASRSSRRSSRARCTASTATTRSRSGAGKQNADAPATGSTPPVFIVVCNNTNVSKLVFDYIAGWEKPLRRRHDASSCPAALPLFSNDDATAAGLPARTRSWSTSEQLESGEAMSAEFKKIAAARDRGVQGRVPRALPRPRRRRPDRRRPAARGDEHRRQARQARRARPLRRLASRCSPKGWDANTVTHILGVRAFGTQLLCEQVVGRGLRRMSYAVERRRACSSPEYAEVYGVPFSFIPARGSATSRQARPDRRPASARSKTAIALRDHLPASGRLPLRARRRAARRRRSPTTRSWRSRPPTCRRRPRTRRSSARRASTRSTTCKRRRAQEVAFLLAKLRAREVLPRRRRRPATPTSPGCFPQVLAIASAGWPSASTCKDDTFPQLLLLHRVRHDAADRIYQAIVAAEPRRARGSSRSCAPYDTDRLDPLRRLRHDQAGLRHRRRQVPHLPRRRRHRTGSRSWPRRWKNGRGRAPTSRTRASASPSRTPSTASERSYIPDFIVRIDDGHGRRRPAEPDRRGHRREAARTRRPRSRRRAPLGAGGQQPRRLRPLGVHRGHRPVGRRRARSAAVVHQPPQRTRPA